MNQPYRDRRKIDPARGATLGDGTPNDNDRVEIGPTQTAFREWEAAGLALPDLGAMRRHRWGASRRMLVARDIRRTSDVRSAEHPLRHRHDQHAALERAQPVPGLLLCADGYMVMWDYKNTPSSRPSTRWCASCAPGRSFFYFVWGDAGRRQARAFAVEIAEVMRAHGGANRASPSTRSWSTPARARRERLRGSGRRGRHRTARAVKGEDEIRAMRCAHHACERRHGRNGALRASAEARPAACQRGRRLGRTSQGNIRRGGEWIETRLLASGPRTNPWFQECGPRIVGRTRSSPSTPT
jgi:Xaa-Pro dipeptidase